jgi:hypothetical protein
MSWWAIPVVMPPAQAFVPAAPDDVFEYLTAFAWEPNEGGPKVLRQEPDGTLLVEFQSQVTGLLGRKKTHRTVERVTLVPPHELRFRGVKGPLDLLSDRISLEPEGHGTRVTYESTVGLGGSVGGWLLCQTYVRLVLGRFMRKHVEGIAARFS